MCGCSYLTGQETTSLARVTFPKSLQLLYVSIVPTQQPKYKDLMAAIECECWYCRSVFRSSLTTLSDAKFPPKLSALYATESAITTICATKFPPTLTLL